MDGVRYCCCGRVLLRPQEMREETRCVTVVLFLLLNVTRGDEWREGLS